MTTFAHLRKSALSLPETAEEKLEAGAVAFTTAQRRFALAEGPVVELYLPDEAAERMLEKHPTAERVDGRGVRVPLADINGQQLNHWLRRAWLSRAPKRLAEQVLAGGSAGAGSVGDLPKAIGNPATRALVGAGLTTLDQVAERTAGELIVWHGIGRGAMPMLAEVVVAPGRQFKAGGDHEFIAVHRASLRHQRGRPRPGPDGGAAVARVRPRVDGRTHVHPERERRL